MAHLNLSRRPFLNTRPVSRVALALWILGALLLLGNVTLFWGYLSGSTDMREDLARKEQQVDREKDSVDRLEARLAGLDLAQQNEQVEYLNRKIAERTFSWSLLFDRLAKVMPDGVRLIQLKPAAIGNDVPGRRGARVAGRRAPALASDRVPLLIEAESKTDEQMLQFVENLFADPAFEAPDISQESREEDNENRVRFSLQVTYIPGTGTPGVTVEEDAPTVVEETPPAAPSPTEEPKEESET